MTVKELRDILDRYPEYYPVKFYGLIVDQVFEDMDEDTGEWQCELYSSEYQNFLREVKRRATNTQPTP